jgi:hypothetical protein
MILENLTPHVINVRLSDGSVISFAPSGTVARVSSIKVPVKGPVDGINTCILRYGTVVGLPDAQFGFSYLVSAQVRLACAERLDLFSPGELIRDVHGQPIACEGLVRNG